MIRFSLNNQAKVFEGDPELSLLKYLREVEGLTSPKDGCAPQGSCGCCTVQLADKAILSCTTSMKQVEGKSILTIEGLPEYTKQTLARALADKGAVQCGFCTPGILVRSKVLLDHHPRPTHHEIVKVLSAHLCRCTGYQKIVEGIAYAAEAMGEKRELVLTKTRGQIGDREPKYEAVVTALGERPFVNDLKFPNLHFGALKLTDHPRARILKIDLESARQMKGVVKIFTAQDVPGERKIGLIVADWPLMIAEGEVTHYVGDVLAVVVAESELEARLAVAQIHVDYEVQSPVVDAHEALKPNSPVVHSGSNLLDNCIVKRGGDAEDALSKSAFQASGIFQTQRIEHAFMEPESCVAVPREQGILDIYSQGQGVYEDQRQISLLLRVPKEKLNVILVPNGGGFGGKEDLSVQGHAALAAHLLGVPVKITLNREESITIHPKRHPIWMDYKIGCDKEGKLTVVKARMVGDSGAYASVGMKVLERAAGHSTGAYNVPVVDVEAKTVYTNNVPCGAMRGFGANQANFAMESLIDELCEKGKFDRWEFRYNNALVDGSVTATGQALSGGVGVRATLLALKDEYSKARYAGLACGIKNTGIGNGMADASKVEISIEREDQVVIYHGWTEMGQGVHTMALQTFCQETGLPPDIVQVKVESRVSNAFTGMTTASRATSLVGNAIIDACKKIKEDLKKGSLKTLVGRKYLGEWLCDFTTKPGKVNKEGKVVTHYSYSYATQLVVLDEHGKIETIYAAHDAGKIMNPTLFESQIEGSLHMGLGYALCEDLPMKDGHLVSKKLKDCQILRARDIPKFVVKGVEVSDPLGPYGAKGVGEIGLVPTAPAVGNAFYQFDGIRRRTLPMKRKES
ncbi:MAG: selenium-dependent xanthine dehydrogenase [Bdellovibrionales bacterium GWA2_49_15]|nr:MAG: selenium-dependent xanthine dehydrogenase [Bdellovibrionales bacterium GWA2_49_15]HAZ14446.1 selenium-dependent xanthine dehydrogenase [Bdellovibrionales bacterium]